MTVEVETARVSYTGSGTTGPFTIPFYFLANADIVALKVLIADGTSTTLALTTDYTLTGAGDEDGGTLTLVATLSSSYKIVIYRDPDMLQGTRYPRNDKFPASTHERALDLLTMLVQRGRDLINRAARLADSDISGADVTLPTPSAGKAIKWNADGDGLENSADEVDDITTAAAASASAASSSASAASTSASNASTSASNASTSASNASTSASNASSSASSASSSASAAAASANAATGVGKRTVWIPAAACVARTTNGAASGSTELATNDVMLRTYDFDQTTSEGVQFMIGMPKNWNEGTITFQPIWTAASGSGDVTWGLRAVAISNDDALDAAFGTAQTSTDTLIATNDQHTGPESSAITIAGSPAEGDLVVLEIYRDISDTLSADAKLIGIRLHYTTNATDDT